MNEEAVERVKQSPGYMKAQKKQEANSTAYQSQKRTMKALNGFYQEVAARRGGIFNGGNKCFQDEERLKQDCSEFIQFCYENGLVPTWSLASDWLGVSMQTMYAAEKVGDSNSETFKKLHQLLFTTLEQFALQREGNPAVPIFLMKAQYGLSDNPTMTVNINDNRQPLLAVSEVLDAIELTPDDWEEVE